jgi:hypothetical protein
VVAVAFALTLPALLAACATTSAVRTAPFRSRPDAVVAGELRGPFTGRVTDAASGAPLAGALVYATWTIERGTGMSLPAGFREHVTSTDASGNYKVPRLAAAIPYGARVTDFHLVVYKRGFVAYRSDRRFADLGPRMDFAQRENQIPLERWHAEYSHARHLRYVGGGSAIAALTSWEADEAVAELAGQARAGSIGIDILPGRGKGTYLVAGQLLTEADVKAATRYDGGFETGPLGDEPDTATYTSQHFKALGRPETYDLALRLWRVDPADALTRYSGLLDSLPGVEETNEMATRSLRASEGEIYGVGFLDSQRGVVGLLTCGKSQCDSPDVAAALARKVHDRIQALWPIGGSK